ncbi:cytoplasmic dynein 2 heavy chain 1 [Anastrepha ludens]|uniref:cytoplasmic dynein 2 heavy chain 1 n=1 Tax=Anastrepha ludens TaxID=28586 RepID=UPI0023B01AE0|nr:cytoplasmic dynein 2 heavy chain 1 [Anastrepha ludens]
MSINVHKSNKSKFIINTSVEYFAASGSTGQAADEHLTAIHEFLENDELTVIAAVHNKSNGSIKFHHRIPGDEVCLLFYKIPQVGGNKSGSTNISSAASSGAYDQPLGILTLEGGLVKSIYNSVSRVFSPQAEARKTEYSPELSGLLESLHVSLGSTLGLPQSGITSVKDEIKFWKQKFNKKSSSRIDREMSQVFIGVLENIDKQMSSIDHANTGTSIEEFLDSSHNSLDELWRLPYHYPQARMADLLDIMGNGLLEICVEQLLMEDIWNLNSHHVNMLMSQCIDTADSWMQLCDSLTRLFWPNYVQHPWLGEPHAPKRGQQFKERLSEIKNIKNLYRQIATLLNDEEMKSMLYESSPFKDINIFDTTALGQSKWNKALQYFEQILQHIDERIASALKAQLHNHLSNARQVIFIFSKYETLIQRPAVLELLTIEREQFLQSLQILLQDLRKAMSDTNMEPDTGHLSVICNECRWLKVVQYQIQEIEKVSHLISGRDGYDKINKAVQEIKEETESLLRTNFEIWCGQCSTSVKSGELKLREDQPVVKFEKEGRQLMRVTFNPKLVTFCQDVREFENLGYNVPAELRSSATHAAKFMSYARRLQQIATFHNTIGDRMIPCQRPIMLKNAVQLSKLVQSETVAWHDEESVQRYVDMLQTAVSKLSADNTLLVGYHEQAKRTVIKLMNTDLFTQTQVWKDEMRHLRDLVAAIERQGYTNLDAFKLHWDHQLYKVLEYQYIIGLVDMNNKLPDIHIDIMFRQRQLCYRPPEEEIREKYFTQLRRFIERPSSFRGLSDNSTELFKSMVEINRHHIGPLFAHAEELFRKLEEFKKIWLPWVALGCVDIEELCGIHLSVAEDWDREFRACKNFSQKIAKIQNSEESIECIIINTSPLRSEIELISRRYWESLTNSLRTAIVNDVTVIQEFLQSSLQFLNNVPMDETSITESGMKYEKMMTELPKVSETLDAVKSKDTCLAGWCKERVTALANILLQWERLQPLIENHAVILQRQVDMIKDQAHSQIQNLQNEAEKFFLRWESTISELESNENATLELFKERQEHWQQLQAKKVQLLEECAKFNMSFPADVLAPFTEIEEKMETQSKQWEIYDKYLSELNTIADEEWAIYRRRPYVLNEFINKWESSVHASIDLPSKRIRQSVERLQGVMPILQQLQSDTLTERHWARIFMLLNKLETKSIHNLFLRDILEDYNALQQASTEIANLVKQAASEQIVRQALTELDQWSVTSNLKLINHKDSAGNTLSLIKDYQEVLNKIGDNQSLLQSAKNSAAFEAFSDQAELWESRLNTLDSLLTSLSQSQRRWVYLEPVFGAGTLRNEEALFRRIDKDFRYVMREIQADPRVISLIKINNISTIVSSLEKQLSRCQNNLMTYIMDKRNSFPRFYFLGDDDLLEILGQATKDAEIIQKHIKKLFPGCHSIGIAKTLNGESTVYTIQSLQSAEGDILQLREVVPMKGPIEDWLNHLVSSIQCTLKDAIFECYSTTDAENFTQSLLRKYPIQVLSITRAIQFTKQTEKAILSMSLRKLHQALNTEITHFANMKNQTNDTLLQIKLRALLFDLVHYASVVEELQEHNVMHVSDWHWLCQLKFYLAGTDGRLVVVRMVYAEFEYSYEFLGNPNKLVNTKLTHKCYLILTQAMHMGLGGNPFGPAGTGKTECVKALGAMLGRLVLVFNCDENVDTESMSLILTGLVRCGAWGCFDEFNRLHEATLSAISMLIQPIQMALKDKSDVVQIGERNIKLNQHCGIFVTLNPAGADYGGRQKLPGNIQALFRPIVMQQPEPLEISRVMLFVEGFQHASEIAERIVELFDLCTKMLSVQRHYDWGLRELKTILLACGTELRFHLINNKNTERISSSEVDTATANDSESSLNMEMSVVVRMLRMSILSKLQLNDVARFDMLLTNVFPEIGKVTQSKSELQQALVDASAKLGLCVNDMQIEKALQLHEQLSKRMGVVVVGPPGCGKSKIIALLRQALMSTATKLTSSSSSSVAAAAAAAASLTMSATQIRLHTINPKSMSRVQLLGRLDPETRQWMDGVLTNTAVMVNAEPLNVHSWIVCDGSIDPEWIEALNSVLDDNRLLTLPSGWRIQFGNNVNFIFETADVRHASPATISRMGIVNMNAADFPQAQILETRLAREEFGDLLYSYIEEQFKPAAQWVESEYLYCLPALNRWTLLRALLLRLRAVQSRDEFCVTLCRALYGFLPPERHNELANFIFERANIYISNPNHAEFAHFNNERGTIEFYESDALPPPIGANGISSGVQLIQTATVKSYLNTLHTYLSAPTNTPFLIVGPTGAAKTLLLLQAVQEYAGYDLIVINCSMQLTPAYILHCLKQNCVAVSGLRGREFKPKQTRVVLFLKNLDLCYLDAWGTSEIMELLLQLVQRAGFYADNLEWVHISGLQICGSISQDPATSMGGGLHKLAPRFLAINQFLRVSYPTDADMLTIVQSQLEPLLASGRFKTAAVNVQYVVEGLLELFKKLQATFTASSRAWEHYNFNPKFIMKLLHNLEYYPAEAFNEAFCAELTSMFEDRLASEADVSEFQSIFRQTMRKFYGREKVFFVPKSSKHCGEFRALAHDAWLEEVQKQITICNAESFIIDEPITRELLDLVSKVARVLARDETHLLLLARAGGRHLDALYAAANLQQAKIFVTQGGAGYGLTDFYNDLKLAMQTAAIEDQCTCLLIDHCWITFAPDIMKPIEAVLEGSEILDLFGDDLESIASSLKHAAQLEGFQESIGAYFLKKAKKNLHLIITLDPANATLNSLFSRFPTLYRNMDIYFVRSASTETQNQLPKKFIEILGEAAGSRGSVPVFSYFTDAVESLITQQAPKRYYQLIRSYFYIYTNFAKDINKRLEKLQHGVDKLATAHNVVDTLKSNAGQQEEALAEKRKLANDALEMISATMRSANDQKTNMLELKKKTQDSSEQLKLRQKEIQQELAEVEPILAEASTAVGQIKSEALSEIRSLRAPPETIRDILEGVLRLMGIRDTSWNSMKTFLAKRGVKEDIRSLDPAHINPDNCVAVEKLLDAKAESFEMKNAKRASAAAAPLAAWVKASVRYSKVIQSIRPLEREQNELQRNLDVAESEMQTLMSGLDDVDNRVKQLSAKLNSYTQEAAVLEIKLDDARKTLNAAEVLIEKLSSEFHTWSMQLDEYKASHKTLDTKSLLIALAINYFSHLTLERRSFSMDRLLAELQLRPFDLRKSLLTEQEQIIWESMGLAPDAQIIENAALLRQMIDLPFGSYPVPLVLDPTQTAMNWLEEYLRTKERPYDITTQSNERLNYMLELAVRFGKVLIVQDCQQVRPPLLQLLQGRFYVKFGKKLLEIGSKMIDLHEQFQLVLFTKTNKLSIEPETLSYLTCIPFTVTAIGLADQLMSKAIILKNPQLERKRIELLKNEGVLLKQRIELEDKLLEELSTAQGDILKNEKLLNTLNEVKESSNFIDKSLKESARVKESLLSDYTQLRELCTKAAKFYIELTVSYELPALAFIQLFLNSLQTFESRNSVGNDSERRVYEQLVCATFQYLARSTSRGSHLTLALYVCKSAYPERMPAAEWEMFVTNFMVTADVSIGSVDLGSVQLPECVGKEAALKLQIFLTQVPQIEEQLQLQKDYAWRSFVVDQTPEMPGDIKSPFHRVLIAQIFRPDLIFVQLRRAAAEILGISPDSVVQPTVEQLADENTDNKPILVITQTENDPGTEIRSVAVKKIGLEKYTELSIGRGMEHRALDAIRQAAELGKWICIKNVHLVPDWLPELDRELEVLKKRDGFRLWLICESTRGFSDTIMYKFVKVLYEFPSGIKHKVRRMLQNFALSDYRSISKEAKLVKIRFVVFIVMAVLQERRKYIPQGWSKYYEFGEADLKAAMEVLLWLDSTMSSGRCDWTILQRLCENVAFGGRINNTRDLQVLQRYLEEFCSADVMNNRWSPLNTKVVVPTSAQILDYISAISKFPDTDEPGVFHLSNHTNISREIEQSKEIIKELRANYYKKTECTEESMCREQETTDLAKMEKQIKPILALWRKLAGKCTVQKTAEELQDSTQQALPWQLFVISELRTAAKCFQEVHQTLSLVHNWFKSTSSNTKSNIDLHLFQMLAENQVPGAWLRCWCGPPATVDYIRAIVIRGQAAELRYRSELHLDFGQQIDLTTVFNSETMLSSLKLTNSRQIGTSCKDLKLTAQVINSNMHSSAHTKGSVITLAPLKVDGAVFTYGKLTIKTDVESRAQEYKSPEFRLTFEAYTSTEEKKSGAKVSAGLIKVPLYSNVSRKKILCFVDVPTTESADVVLLSGAALIVPDF